MTLVWVSDDVGDGIETIGASIVQCLMDAAVDTLDKMRAFPDDNGFVRVPIVDAPTSDAR